MELRPVPLQAIQLVGGLGLGLPRLGGSGGLGMERIGIGLGIIKPHDEVVLSVPRVRKYTWIYSFNNVLVGCFDVVILVDVEDYMV